MKRILSAALLLSLISLAGCIPAINGVSEVRLVSNDAVIYAPQVNGNPFGYNANVQPGELIYLNFNPGRDQYGNSTGFSSSRYSLETVTAICDLKTEADTIFNTDDGNVIVWFPAYTGKIEKRSGLPFPLYPLVGYPWNPCRKDDIPTMGSQMATITATARATWIEVEFVLPEQDGSYRLDLPGQSWTSENVIKIRIDSSGAYSVEDSGGTLYEFDVPIDWFFIEGSWRIDVGPEGTC